jgi:hypothetical protein
MEVILISLLLCKSLYVLEMSVLFSFEKECLTTSACCVIVRLRSFYSMASNVTLWARALCNVTARGD